MTSPVFVDPSGRRRWVLRIVIGAAVTCVLAYLTLLTIALAGGPVNPSALLPIPAVETPAVTTTAPPVPTTTAAVQPVNVGTSDVDTTTTPTTTAKVKTPTEVSSQPRRADPPGASNRPTPPGKG